jgi:hypothetical protein
MHLYFQVKLRRRLSSTLCVPPPARLVVKLGDYAPNYYSMTTRVVSTSSLARGGLAPTTTRRSSYGSPGDELGG